MQSTRLFIRIGISAIFAATSLLATTACSSDDSSSTPTSATPAPAPAPAPAPTPAPPPTPAPEPPPPPPAPAVLSSLTLSANEVVGQTQPTATVTLTAPAPTGGAVIRLETTDANAAKVPANVSVPAGSTTATFLIDTATVDTKKTVTITATYADVARTATVIVLLVRPRALFTVISPELGNDKCKMIRDGLELDCRLDGRISEGRIVRWSWALEARDKITATRPEPGFGEIDTSCKLINGASTNDDDIGRFTMLRIQLEVTDKDGDQNTSSREVKLYVDGVCDF